MSGFIDYRSHAALIPLADYMASQWYELYREAVGALDHFVPSPEVQIQAADDIRLFILPIKWRGDMASELEQLCHGDQILEAVPIAASLAEHPLVTSAMFSMSMPGCELIPHIDNESHIGDVLRIHLGLSCPTDCALTIGDESREWHDGEVMMFDSARVEHSAHNRSAAPRLILILDVDRQALAAAA